MSNKTVSLVLGSGGARGALDVFKMQIFLHNCLLIEMDTCK
jgi:hypothetical protein